MNPANLSSRPAAPRVATVVMIAWVLAGCAGLGEPRTTQGVASQTVVGNYEAIAGCVAETGEKSAGGGAPVLRIDRAQKSATVRRVLPADELQYEISFVQTGGTTVQVEGRAAPAAKDGGRSFAFLWPHVGLCATDRMAP